MATLVGALLVSLGLDSAKFKSGLTDAQKRMQLTQKQWERTGANMQSVGKKMSLMVTAPMVLLGKKSFDAAVAAKDAIGGMEAALKSMGPAAGFASADLQDMALDLEKVSAFDDKEILRKVTSNMLTFGNISGDAFARAQKAAVDLASRMNTDLQSATIMVGKALNDPIKGLAAMSRVGIQFTKDQQAMIKSMVAGGDAAGAQAIMLTELERQFGGAGQAARDAAPGSDTLNKWSDLKESIGATLLVVADRAEPILNRLLDSFNGLSPGMQTTAIAAAAVAAALGPVLFIGGSVVKMVAPLAGLLTSGAAGFAGLGAAALPVAAIVAGVAAAGYLVYQNWDKIAPVLQQVWQTVQEVFGPPLTAIFDSVKTAVTSLVEGPFGTLIATVAVRAVEQFGAIWETIKGPLTTTINVIATVVSTVFNQVAGIINTVAALLQGDFSGAWTAAKGVVSAGINGMLAIVRTLAPGAIEAVQRLYTGVKTWLQDKLGAVFDWVGGKVEKVKGFFFGLYDAVVGHSYIPDMVEGIRLEMLKLDAAMVDPTQRATKKAADAYRDMAGEVHGLLDRLFPEMKAAADRAADFKLLEDARKGGMISDATAAEARRRVDPIAVPEIPGLSPEILDRLSKVGDEWLAQIEPIVAANDNLKQSVADMADGIGRSLSNLLGAIKGGGFLDILDGVLGLLDQIGGSMKGGLNIGGLQFGGAGGGFNGGLGGGGGLSSAGGLLGSIAGLFGGARAKGGPVDPSRAYMVGERGPELFRPASAGRIVANDQLGGPTQIVVHVQANDYFDAKVANISDSRVSAAAPTIAAGTAGAMQRRQSRRLA